MIRDPILASAPIVNKWSTRARRSPTTPRQPAHTRKPWRPSSSLAHPDWCALVAKAASRHRVYFERTYPCLVSPRPSSLPGCQTRPQGYDEGGARRPRSRMQHHLSKCGWNDGVPTQGPRKAGHKHLRASTHEPPGSRRRPPAPNPDTKPEKHKDKQTKNQTNKRKSTNCEKHISSDRCLSRGHGWPCVSSLLMAPAYALHAIQWDAM